MRAMVFVVLLVGCSEVPDSDIDGDGIADDEDFCQASFADEVVDFDGDSKDATLDLCPHDKVAASGDLDFDGIPDTCDPFFDEVRPDTRRCITSFGVRWVNATYLSARDGGAAFDLAPPLSTTSSSIAEIISSRPLLAPTVSFDIVGEARFEEANSSFAFMLRTGARRDVDVGCGIDATRDVYVIANGAREASRPIDVPIGQPFAFRLRASVGGSNATVLCRLTVGAETATTTFETSLPAGGWGFASELTDVRIDSMVIDTNDAPVSFRHSHD
jgi:hypothetical protein